MIRNFISKLYSLYTPSIFMSGGGMSGGGSPSGYVITRSLRCNAASSNYLTRTPGVTGNRKTWTWSGWVKRGTLGVSQGLFEGRGAGTTGISIASSNTLQFQVYDGTVTYNSLWTSTAVFRDPSALYHIVCVFDTTQALVTNMVKVYVNDVQITLTYSKVGTTHPAQNSNWYVNSITAHNIGLYVNTNPFDGYMSEVNFIDGQALTPSSFGEINPATGQWVAKKYTGTYGTNGFYLDFKEGTSTTTLGDDKSGNNNDWTLTNFTRSAGVNDCWMLDVPAGNGSASAVQPSSNYPTLNPLDTNRGSPVLSNANLTLSDTASLGTWGSAASSIVMNTGKWYCEVTPSGAVTTSPSTDSSVIVAVSGSETISPIPGTTIPSVAYWTSGQKIVNNTFSAYGATYTTETIGCAFDADNLTVEFFKGGVSQGVISIGPSAYGYKFAFGAAWASAGKPFMNVNFGQRSFAYTPPAGFKALCTANLTSTDVIESGSFTGNATANGPFIWLNGTPETLTINGNAVTWGTHADKLSNGFKLRTSSSSYNSSGTNTWTATILSPESKSAFKHQNAKGN